MKGEGKKRKSAEVRVCASAHGSAHVHARSGGTGGGVRGKSADESANENNKKGGDLKSPQVSG